MLSLSPLRSFHPAANLTRLLSWNTIISISKVVLLPLPSLLPPDHGSPPPPMMSLPFKFGWNSLLDLRLSIEVKRSEPTEFIDSVSPIFAGNRRMIENERRTMFNDSYFLISKA